MSGTSMDGIDAALMKTDGKQIIESIATISLSYSPEFKLSLRKAELSVKSAKKNVAPLEVINQSTELHAEIVLNLIKKANLEKTDIDLIGYHGQSLYHNPSEGITIQMGDGQLLANLTGISVVNDFRSEDLKNAGQGAPLAPLYHQALALKLNLFPATFINCGGISNVSIIKGEDETQISGFDTGPGNVLIDRYIRQATDNQEFMDLDGKYGLQGTLNHHVLEKLIYSIKPYLDKSAPKSLDPNDLQLIKKIDDLSIYDACATLEYFTAYCIAKNIDPTHIIILAGGGWNNPVILRDLKLLLPSTKIYTADEANLDSAYMEAEIFAYLAVRSLYKLPISLSSVTGAKISSSGGKIYIPII